MESQQQARVAGRLLGLVILALGVIPRADAADARVILNADRFVVGSKWSLDILVDTPDPLSVRLTAPTLPASLALAEGPYIRETSWEKVPGSLSRATKISLTLRTLQPGIVEVGPFELRVGKSLQTVAPVTVYLLAPDEAKRRFPIQLRWVVPSGPFYEGQAIPLMLQARNLDTLAQPEDLNLGPPPGSLWEKAVGLGEIEINSIGEDRLMNVPWGGWMLIATKKGTVVVPSVKAQVAGLTRTVAPLALDILPLPDIGGGRAVGDFAYSIEAKAAERGQGGQVVVTQEISGRGNFPYLVLPEVSGPGLTLTSRQEGTRYRAARGGYEGSLVVTWRFATDGVKVVSLALPGFAAFQPTTGRIDTWEPRAVTVTLPDAASTPEPVLGPLGALDWEGVQGVRPWGVVQAPWSWLLFLPGVAFLAMTFFLPGKGPRRGLVVLLSLSVVLVSASEGAPEGFAEASAAQGWQAAELWADLTARHPGEPGLWYNKALACQDAGRTAEAVHAYRMALRTGFQGDQAARGLEALEQKELLNDQLVPWTGLAPNWLFLGLCLSVNLVFVFWGLQRLTGRPIWLLPLSAVFLSAVVAATFLGAAEASRLESDAVVGLADGPIRKVPGDLAETWMTLKAGTVVRIQGHSDRWALVQTGYGLEGWVEQSGLLLVAEP